MGKDENYSSYPRAGLRRCVVRLQGAGAPPAAAPELDSGRRHIYGGKIQISNLAFVYTCAEILLFLYLNLVYLYIQFRFATLFLKFSKFVT